MGYTMKMIRKVIQFEPGEVIPAVEEVLRAQRMVGRKVPERILALLDQAMEMFRRLADPKGILEQWPVGDFAAVFDADGANDPDGPVRRIVPKADAIAFFVATLGDALLARSSELFQQGEAPLGYLLDAVNSSAGERLGGMMCRRFIDLLAGSGRGGGIPACQYYCPGHCGWHLSGQRKLFEVVRPEEIGIDLKANHAMYPLKSISGVLVAGDMDIHRFSPGFPFCGNCKEHKCVERLAKLEKENPPRA